MRNGGSTSVFLSGPSSAMDRRMTLEATAPPSWKAEVLHGVCLVSIRACMTKLGRRYSVLRSRIMGPFCQLEFLPCHTKEIRVTVQCVHQEQFVCMVFVLKT